MATRLPHDHPTLIIRRAAYERAGIVRAALDERLGLTDEEFRVDGDLVLVGPIPAPDALTDVVAELEAAGLTYFDDFFDVSGNWPAWMSLIVTGAGDAEDAA